MLLLLSLLFPAVSGTLDTDGDTVTDDLEFVGDTDGDGVDNYLDADDDGDGVPTIDENWDMNAAQCTPIGVGTGVLNTDRDRDGILDYLDADDDNDSVPTLYENLFRTNALCVDSDLDNVPDGAEWCAHPCVHPLTDAQYRTPRSTDDDGIIDALDEDDDQDGVLTFDEGTDDIDSVAIGANGPLSVGCSISEIIRCDFRPDGIPNYLDTNSDGDCYPDGASGLDTIAAPSHTYDESPFSDQDGDGLPDITDCLDNDGCNGDADGDGLENCDERDVYFSDPYRTDTDGDGIPDGVEAGPVNSPTNSDGTVCAYTDRFGNTSMEACYDIRDPDDDNDGVPTRIELCLVPPAVGGDCADTDRYVWPTIGIADPPNTDHFPPDASDGPITTDLIPDYLDPDDDGDGISTLDEDGNGDGDPVNDDSDDDGIADYLDPLRDGPCVDNDEDGIPDAIEQYLGMLSDDEDSDADGVLDTDEAGQALYDFIDADLDGVYCDDPAHDAESDGTADLDGLLQDSDGDGTPDVLDTDDDNDGIPTSVEVENSAFPLAIDNDTDMDGTPDYLDLDSDDDNLPDEIEGASDDNQDGVPNYLEPYVPGEIGEPPPRRESGCSCQAAPAGTTPLWWLLTGVLLRRRSRPAQATDAAS